MELINNAPHYSRTEMEKAGFAPRTLERWSYPIKIKHPKDKREAWYSFNELRPKYQAQIIDALGDPNSQPEPKEPHLPLDKYSKRDIELALARYNLLKAYRLAGSAKGSKVQAKQAFVDSVCAGYLFEKEYEIVGRKLSFKTLERWNKTMRDGSNTMDDLLPKLREISDEIALLDIHKEVLKRSFLNKNEPKISEAIRMAFKVFKATGIEVPSESKCRRFLVDLMHNEAATCTLIRKGMKAMKDGLMPYIERDPDSIEFLDVLVADGHVMNFQVINPKTGKPARPTLIGWIDMRTRMIMGWEMMLTENTMAVASSLRMACINSAKMCGVDGAILPRIIYVDNGKSFKNKFFNEKVDLESQIGGLFERLKPYGLEDVTYAIPYNARSKVIERAWGCMAEIERQVPTYVGINIESKPANLMRNEKLAREAYEAYLSKNNFTTIFQAYLIVSDWINEYNSRQASGKYLNGYSPLSLASEQIPGLDIAPRLLPGQQLNFLMMHTKVGRLKRNGFNINGIWYYNAAKFAQVAKDDTEYIVKYDIINSEKVLVYYEDGTLWCEAGRMIGQDVHAMAKLGSQSDREHLEAAIEEQNDIIKQVENTARAEMGMKPKGTRIQKVLPEKIKALVEASCDDDYITTSDGRKIKLRYF